MRAVDRTNVGLVFDLFHFARSGYTPEMLDGVHPEEIFSIQLCDGPVVPRGDDYFEEVVSHRLLPGDGEFPLVEMLSSLAARGPLPPAGPEVLSLDIFELSPVEAGRICAEKSRDLLSKVAGAK